jgi:hypothetical protein
VSGVQPGSTRSRRGRVGEVQRAQHPGRAVEALQGEDRILRGAEAARAGHEGRVPAAEREEPAEGVELAAGVGLLPIDREGAVRLGGG